MRRFKLPLLALLLVSVFLASGCTPEYDREHKYDEYERGYEEGYKNGYEDGRLDGGLSACGDVYYAIEDMAFSDVVAFVEGDEENKVISYEDLYALFSYAMQRGYIAGATGTWDSTMEEYVLGYDVTDRALEFERFFGLDPVRYRSANGLYLNTWADNGQDVSYSKVFDAWQDWAWRNK